MDTLLKGLHGDGDKISHGQTGDVSTWWCMILYYYGAVFMVHFQLLVPITA